MSRKDPFPCDTCHYEDFCRTKGMCCAVYRHWTNTCKIAKKRRRVGGDNGWIYIEQIPDRAISLSH